MFRAPSITDEDELEERPRAPCSSVIAVAIIQLLLAPLLLCYSIFLTNYALNEYFYEFEDGLWTVVIFVSTSKISEPWTKSYCKYLDIVQHRVHRRNIILSAIFLFFTLAGIPLISSPAAQIIIYGFFSGLFSTIIAVHVKFYTKENFEGHPRVFETLEKLSKPLSLFSFPYFLLFLLNVYGAAYTHLIVSAILLNIIPACLLIRPKKILKKVVGLHKFQTFDKLSFEMSDMDTTSRPVSQSSSSLSDEESDEKILEQPPPSQPAEISVHVYYQHIGVNILPEIPEENETEDEDDINEISSKRLSKISSILLGLKENGRKDVTLSVTNLFQPDETIERTEEDGALESNSNIIKEENNDEKRRFFSISSDFKFELRLKRRRIKEFFVEHFVKSVPTNFCNLYIYPAIVSHSVITILSTIFLASAPYYAVMKGKEFASSLDTEDAAFLLVIIGFGWTFFLAGYHVLSKLSDLKIKVLFIFGLFILAASMYVAQRFSNDNLTVSCLLFGLGHGIVNYTEGSIHERFFGEVRWRKGQSALEIIAALIVILIYFVIYFINIKISVLLAYAHWPYVCNAILWIVSLIVKEIVVQTKNMQRHNRERYPDFNF